MNRQHPIEYRNILDSVATGVFTIDRDRTITYFNREAERLTGFTQAEAIGRKCYEIFRTDVCLSGCYLQKAIHTGERIAKVRVKILNKRNEEVPVDITASILLDNFGDMAGGVETFVDDSVRTTLEKKIRAAYCFEDIVGRDEKMLRIIETLRIVAPTDAPVLVLGETGTGKDIVARAIHHASHRCRGPFIKVNCAALPPHLLESELFGYKKGAFTDARHDKPGRFELGEGGTIFLDEIGAMPVELQAKLLQVLDDKEFYPLGSTRPAKVNVRLIASTNRRLRRATLEPDFRADLYFRMSVVEVEIPPLRSRPGDISLLIDHFLTENALLQGKGRPEVPADVMKLLLDYSYPGNVRELKNIIEHAVILSQGGRIDRNILPVSLFLPEENRPLTGIPTAPDRPVEESTAEREDLLNTLRNYKWNRSRAARALHINRTTLWRRMKKLSLIPQGVT